MEQDSNPGEVQKSAWVRRAWWIGLAVALAYLIPSLFLLGDYGPTWDCVQGEYPYGERVLSYVIGGDEAFLGNLPTEPHPTLRAPHPDFDVQRFRWSLIPPFVSVLSAISCRILWTEWGLIPALSAHNLVIVLMVACLVCFWVRFLIPRIGTLGAVFAGASLALLPRFLAHSFNNLKDPPETCLYVLAVTLAYVALTRTRRIWWILAGTATALSLATRPNAFFIPVQMFAFYAVVRLTTPKGTEQRVRVPPRSFLLGCFAFLLAYYAASPPYWAHPIDGPPEVIRSLLNIGNSLLSGAAGEPAWWRSVSLHAPKHLLWTTPPLLLVLAAIGLFRRGIATELRVFLWIGLLLPLTRNMIPGMRNYGGVRHILELFPFLCAFAGMGLSSVAETLARATGARRTLLQPILALVALAPSAAAVVRTHPNEVCYFNSLVGGLGGAQDRRISDAGDYWCNSYWQGMEWVDAHAEAGAFLYVPHAGWVARAMEPVRLRPDLRLWNPDEPLGWHPLFVMFTTGYHGALRSALEEELAPVHEIRVQAGTVLFVYEVPPTEQGAAILRTLLSEQGDRRAMKQLLGLLKRDPETYRAALAIGFRFRAGELELGAATRRIQALLPAAERAGSEDAIRHLLDLL